MYCTLRRGSSTIGTLVLLHEVKCVRAVLFATDIVVASSEQWEAIVRELVDGMEGKVYVQSLLCEDNGPLLETSNVAQEAPVQVAPLGQWRRRCGRGGRRGRGKDRWLSGSKEGGSL